MNYYNYHNQNSPFNGIINFIKSRNKLSMLIIINVAVWLGISVLSVFAWLFNVPADVFTDKYIISWLAVPSNLSILKLKPWTIFSYMFLHIDFWHILFNMLWLYWFGKIFLEFLSEKKLISTYMIGGIAGAALYILAYNIFPVFSKVNFSATALGASASVMAIVFAISLYVPNYTINLLFIGNIRIIYIAVFSFAMDFLMIRTGNSGGHIAHIGGALWGVIYISQLKKGRDASIIIDFFNRIFNSLKKTGTRFKVSYNDSPKKERPLSDEDYNFQKAQHQKKIDGILDKISKSGYDSLTREEKELLFKSSSRK